MVTRLFDVATYKRIGSPGLNCKVYYFNKKTGVKCYGRVAGINYNCKKKIKLSIKPLKKGWT